MSYPREVKEVTSGVYWVGIRDWERKFFDKLVPLPEGTSYNSYLVPGQERTALIDTVNPGFEEDLEEKVRQVTAPENLDYLIMNHAEPDHANALNHMAKLSEKAKIVVTPMGKQMALSLYDLPEERIQVVTEGDTIDLGDKTLQFIEAPWLHWPETMFTYLREGEVLFPCDFLGAHVSTTALFAEDFDGDYLELAKNYFGEIMMPFRPRAKRALDKLKDYEISIVAPSHGAAYRDPREILSAHRSWVDGEVKKKVLMPYVSMWGSTAKLVQVFEETVAAAGIEAVPFEVSSRNLDTLAGELVDSSGIVFGTPTVLAGPHPQISTIAILATKLNPPTKFFGVLESHGWAGGAVRELEDLLEGMEGELLGAVEIKGAPEEKDLEEVAKLGQKFVKQIS